MRHNCTGRKLSRTSSHRKALMRNMVTSLLEHERIETTLAKAKELRIEADHMITLAKKGDLHARRQALAYIQDKDVVYKLFGEIKDRSWNETAAIPLSPSCAIVKGTVLLFRL